MSAQILAARGYHDEGVPMLTCPACVPPLEEEPGDGRTVGEVIADAVERELESEPEIVQVAQRVARSSVRVREAAAELEQAREEHEAAVAAARDALDREAA